MGQYVDSVEAPDHIAQCRWHDTLLASFVLLKRDFGEAIATEICDMSLDDRCLYPYEMQRAGQELRDGGNVDTLFRLMEEGQLAASPLTFPKLRDAAPELLPKPAQEMTSQF